MMHININVFHANIIQSDTFQIQRSAASKSKPQLNAAHNVQQTNSNVLLQFYSESKMKVIILFTSITVGIRGGQYSFR